VIQQLRNAFPYDTAPEYLPYLPQPLDVLRIWPYYFSMAVPTVKTTYSLDLDTVRMLEQMAKSWNVSKSKALRRAIRLAASQPAPGNEVGLRALDELQRSLRLSAEKARRWEQRVRDERRASRDESPR
jgi:hypothetical protein